MNECCLFFCNNYYFVVLEIEREKKRDRILQEFVIINLKKKQKEKQKRLQLLNI
jgi:hypothetical protein